MAHLKKVETNQRRNGKTIAHWEVRWKEWEIRPDGSRKARYRQETLHTKAAAEERLAEIENAQSTQTRVIGQEAKREPFAVYAVAWFDSLSGGIKARTLAEYRRIYTHYIAPEFATRPVGSITAADARRFRAGLVNRGLARGTIKHAFDVFRRILDLAVVDGAITANPAAPVPIPRPNATGDTEPFTPHPLTPTEVAAVAADIGASYPIYGLVVLFLSYSGLRAAELAGLEIGDFDLNRGTVTVRRTKRKIKGGWETGTPKSRKSRRTVPLDGWLVDDLREYLAAHPRRTETDAPVFPARYGRNAPGVPRAALSASPDNPAPVESYNWAVPIGPGTFYANYFKPALAAVGLPVSTPATADHPEVRGVRLHDLRHSYAVISLSAGAHYMAVSKWLGHESFVTTLSIYADYIDSEEGGKAVPLARPTAPAKPVDNVVPIRRAAR